VTCFNGENQKENTYERVKEIDVKGFYFMSWMLIGKFDDILSVLEIIYFLFYIYNVLDVNL